MLLLLPRVIGVGARARCACAALAPKLLLPRPTVCYCSGPVLRGRGRACSVYCAVLARRFCFRALFIFFLPF